MKRFLFLVVAISAFALADASAQHISAVRNALAHATADGGFVNITEDEGVRSAVAKVEASTATPAKTQGYRFVIFYDNAQFADERASSTLKKFRSQYKDVSSYLDSESPSFRVVVGDCFNYEEVAIVRNRIIDDYPGASLSEASIPYRVLCRIKGANNMKIERSGAVLGGVELDEAYFVELDVDGNAVQTVEQSANVETADVSTVAESSAEEAGGEQSQDTTKENVQ